MARKFKYWETYYIAVRKYPFVHRTNTFKINLQMKNNDKKKIITSTIYFILRCIILLFQQFISLSLSLLNNFKFIQLININIFFNMAEIMFNYDIFNTYYVYLEIILTK